MSFNSLVAHPHTTAELRLSGPVGAAVEFGLAALMLAPLLFLSKLAGMQFLAVQLGFIGAIYFGFAIADGGVTALLVEFAVAGVFLFAGAIALWADATVFLAGAYAAHALWDAAHHPRAVSMPVRNWYPPFCVAYDVVCADLVLLRETWDYPPKLAAFLRWVGRVARSTAVANPPTVVRWNHHKGYLCDLAGAGVPVVPTTVVPGGAADVDAVLRSAGAPTVVVKPAVGIGGDDAERGARRRPLLSPPTCRHCWRRATRSCSRTCPASRRRARHRWSCSEGR